MIAIPTRTDRVATSPLGRANPLATLAVAIAWLVARATPPSVPADGEGRM